LIKKNKRIIKLSLFNKQKYRFQKLLKIAYASIAVLLVAVITLSFLLSSKSNFNKNVCTTKACIKAANMILQNMDPTVDPCN
jgi:hypothetical protein